MKRTPDEVRALFQQTVALTHDAKCIASAIGEVAAQLCEQNIFAEKMAFEAKRINDHAIERDLAITVKIRAHHEMLNALKALYEETADYIRVNNLGDAHHNRSMQLARDAIKLGECEL